MSSDRAEVKRRARLPASVLKDLTDRLDHVARRETDRLVLRKRTQRHDNSAQPDLTAKLLSLDDMTYDERHTAESVDSFPPHLLAWCQVRLDFIRRGK